jgi:hypothetical protein
MTVAGSSERTTDMGKEAPPPGDFAGAAREMSNASRDIAREQTQANRPNQTNAFGATTQWTQGPDGQWSQRQSFGGPMAGAANSLQQQLAGTLGQPLDFGSLGALGTGDAARSQAIESAYNQSASRLDPMFQRREDSTRTRLLNQGLVEGSEAYNQQMGDLGRDRNDAYTSALASAISQGTAAGDSVFRNNLASRQQGMSEMLRARGQPLAEMQALQGFLGQPSFMGAGAGQAPNLLGAAQAQHGADMAAWQGTNQAYSDLFGGLLNAGMGIFSLASDERIKRDIQRLPEEAAPGVPVATWEYLREPGRRYRGVIAQDVQKHYPHLVGTMPDGHLFVHPIFAPEPLP